MRLKAASASAAFQIPVVGREPLRIAIVGEVRAVVVIVAVEVTPLDVGVTDVGFSVHEDPAGAPVQVSATAVVKLFNPVTVTVEVPELPAAKLKVAGATAMEKSGPELVPVPLSVAVCGLLASLSATLSVAVTAPAAVGVNVTLMVQVLPTARVVPQAEVWAKDDAPAPVMLTAMLLTVVVLLFFSVTVCALLVVLMAWLPKLTVAGERKTGLGGAVPVPVRGTLCGLEASLSATLSVAVSAAMTDGVNVTAIEHVVPAAIEPVHVEVPTAKSAALAPAIETLVIVSELPVRFASVTTRPWLVTPTGWLPKFTADGLRMTPVAAAGDNFATNAPPVLNVV
jgi:hypothetical protein